MTCVDEILNRIGMIKDFSLDTLRIILNDYDIERKSTELVVVSENKAKALQMFFVTKKVEGCSDKTIQYYSYVLRRFFSDIACDLDRVTADQIRYYIAIRSQRDGLSKVTQDNELRVLKSFFGWCTAEEYISKNPTLNVKAIKQDKRIKKPFSEVDLEKIRKAAETKRDKAIVETLYSTGCRVSELCGMNRNDINSDEIIVFGKGGKERVCYLNAKARLALADYIESRTDNDAALFVSEDKPHTRLKKSSIEILIRKIGKSAGVENCHPHRFRRTAATVALNRGMPIDQVQQMLGHAIIGTTTIYARSDSENVKASHKKYVI